MRLSVKHLQNNACTHGHDEVKPGTQYGFWRVVEHTGAGWFPWPRRFKTKQQAKKAIEKITWRGIT